MLIYTSKAVRLSWLKQDFTLNIEMYTMYKNETKWVNGICKYRHSRICKYISKHVYIALYLRVYIVDTIFLTFNNYRLDIIRIIYANIVV